MWMFVVVAQFDKHKLEVSLMLKVVVINENDVKMMHEGWEGICVVRGW